MVKSGNTYRIAFVSTMGGVPWGGSEELWSQTAMHMKKLGHDIRVSVYDWPQRHGRLGELASAGADVSFRPRGLTFAGRMKGKLLTKISGNSLDRAVLSWLREQAPELVVISQGYTMDGVPWMSACRELGLAYCPIIHANSEAWWPEDGELESLRSGFSGARKLFFVSRPNQNLMEMQCGMRFEEAEIVVNPWKVDASEPVPWPDSDEVMEIACVGRLDPRAKGQDVLMQVLAQEKWKARPLRLNVYGDGPCEHSLKALSGLFDLKNVSFKGQVSEVRTIWAKNHAMILPSRFEGLPLVIVEAMFCGRMVITTEVAGNTEHIIDGVNGFVAAAPTWKLLDDAMERAWSRKSEWREIGAKARDHVIAEIPENPIQLFSQKLHALCQDACPPGF